jgi:hypothetical protein
MAVRCMQLAGKPAAAAADFSKALDRALSPLVCRAAAQEAQGRPRCTCAPADSPALLPLPPLAAAGGGGAGPALDRPPPLLLALMPYRLAMPELVVGYPGPGNTTLPPDGSCRGVAGRWQG